MPLFTFYGIKILKNFHQYLNLGEIILIILIKKKKTRNFF